MDPVFVAAGWYLLKWLVAVPFISASLLFLCRLHSQLDGKEAQVKLSAVVAYGAIAIVYMLIAILVRM